MTCELALRLHKRQRMKRLLLATLALLPVLPAAGNQDPDANVNSRYIVERVAIDPAAKMERLSVALREELQNLVGAKVDDEALNALCQRIREELKVANVTPKVKRGEQPEHVLVVFEAPDNRSYAMSANVSNPLYHSKLGWSGQAEVSTNLRGNEFAFGLGSNGNELLERFSGIRASYRRKEFGGGRFGFVFDFESFHEQWSRRTENELAAQDGIPGIYRSRMNFQPTLTIVLLKPLTLSVGASVQSFEKQFPAARTEASNSLVNSLRYSRDWEDSDHNKQSVDAGYELRAATNRLDSDFAYARHHWYASCALRRGRHRAEAGFLAGRLTGRAPLYERFVLGNSWSLRGWSMYDVAPLGGDRMVHGRIEYGYSILQVFYDTGAVWEHTQSPEQKHSLGIAVKKKGFQLAMAFPLRDGRLDPVFMASMAF